MAARPFRAKRKFGELGLMALQAMKRPFGGSQSQRMEADEEKIAVLQQNVRRLKSSVDKKIFQNTSGITYAQAGTITYLSTIAQGVTLADRVGLDVSPDVLNFDEQVAFTAQGAVRVIVFQDRLCAGTLPTVLDVLSSATVNATYNPTNQLNKRHKILADYSIYAVLTDTNQFTHKKRTIKRMNKVKYLDGTAVIGGAGAGSIFVLRITNLGASFPVSDFKWELKFRG